MASRYCNAYTQSKSAHFGLRTVEGKTITGALIYGSFTGEETSSDYGLRPIVTLNSGIKFIDGDGSAENAWNIK